MKLPLSWLSDYIDYKFDPKELANNLLNIGFEVEEIIFTGKNIDRVVVGKIKDIKPLIDSNKLQICTVDVGDALKDSTADGSNLTTIVTGANNIKIGDYVPVALDGSTLPNKKIVASALRGIMSYGMLCSGSELGIDNSVMDGAEVDGILILPPSKTGQDIKDTLSLNDYILDVSITANRPDCQSIYGLAKEIATIYNLPIKKLPQSFKSIKKQSSLKIKIESYDFCSRYMTTTVSDIKVCPSPKWLTRRLAKMGVRPINNIVDITNYVLMEVGQPMHAFDADKLQDNTICIRNANNGEAIKTLDDKNHTLYSTMSVIADSKNALAIAGVMGGAESSITQNTTNIVFESARFSRSYIRSTSRKLGLRSDSSARFEKGVDWLSVECGMNRALSLIDELGIGTINNSQDIFKAAPKAKAIETSLTQFNNLLGIEIEQKTVTEILRNLGIEVKESGEKLSCTIPLNREDIDNYTDLCEEVIRFYGYDKIKSTLLKTASTTVGGISQNMSNANKMKNYFCSLGYNEICTYSFINKKQYDMLGISENDEVRKSIEIINSLSEEYAVMRTQMIGSMLNTLYLNINRKNTNIMLFEVGKNYFAKQLPLTELPHEENTLCIGAYCSNYDFYSMKATIAELFRRNNLDCEFVRSTKTYLHGGISADIIADKEVIGSFGKIHPQIAKNYDLPENVFVAEINVDSLLEKSFVNILYKALPKFPSIQRDLAIIIKKEVMIGELISEIKSSSGEFCESVELFDIYEGKQIEDGHKSVALSLSYQSMTETLVEAQVNDSITNIMESLKAKFNAQLR